MKVTISIETESPKAAAELLAKVAGAEFVSVPATAAPAAGKRGRKPKSEAPAHSVEQGHAEVSEEEMENDADNEGGEEIEDFDDFSEDDSEAEDEDARIDEAQVSKLKKALNAYSQKNSKEKAIKVLLQYGKTSSEVKKKDFAKVMKALGAK